MSKLHRQPSATAPAVASRQVLKMATLNAAQPALFHESIGPRLSSLTGWAAARYRRARLRGLWPLSS